MALEKCTALGLDLDRSMVDAAAMLHDIGVVNCKAPAIGGLGRLPYICHGIEGARMLRKLGAPEYLARVSERHTGSGLTATEIEAAALPLPHRDLVPESLLEQLICYCDKFFSKNPSRPPDQPYTLEKIRDQMAAHGTGALQRFEALHALLG